MSLYIFFPRSLFWLMFLNAELMNVCNVIWVVIVTASGFNWWNDDDDDDLILLFLRFYLIIPKLYPKLLIGMVSLLSPSHQVSIIACVCVWCGVCCVSSGYMNRHLSLSLYVSWRQCGCTHYSTSSLELESTHTTTKPCPRLPRC